MLCKSTWFEKVALLYEDIFILGKFQKSSCSEKVTALKNYLFSRSSRSVGVFSEKVAFLKNNYFEEVSIQTKLSLKKKIIITALKK